MSPAARDGSDVTFESADAPMQSDSQSSPAVRGSISDSGNITFELLDALMQSDLQKSPAVRDSVADGGNTKFEFVDALMQSGSHRSPAARDGSDVTSSQSTHPCSRRARLPTAATSRSS